MFDFLNFKKRKRQKEAARKWRALGVSLEKMRTELDAIGEDFKLQRLYYVSVVLGLKDGDDILAIKARWCAANPEACRWKLEQTEKVYNFSGYCPPDEVVQAARNHVARRQVA